MIKELLIRNFQAHEKFSAKLDPHITSFTGATDSGKSSIIRAIKWLVLNRPRGDSFFRDEDEDAFVGIKTDKGKVSRKRGKNVNNYTINGQVLEAFGTDVPEEVQQFLNMAELNFQFQFDAPYWFWISPGEVSKQLNEIVDLNIIDTTLGKLSNQVRLGKTTLMLSKENLDEIELKLYQLEFVEPMTKQYDKLEQMKIKIDDGHNSFVSLDKEITNVRKYILQTNHLSSAHSAGQKVLKIGNKYKKEVQLVETLTDIIQDLKETSTLSEMEIPNIDKLISITDEWKEKKDFHKKLYRCITEAKTERQIACLRKKELSFSEKELKKMIGQTCPLCGNRMKTKS